MTSFAFVRPSLAAIATLALAAPSRADTLKVPQQFETIQAAVDAAVAGDIVSVAKGTYEENVFVGTAGIALRGKGAVINGRYFASCVTVTADDVEVSGFTLVNGGHVILLGPGDGTPGGGVLYTGTGALLSKLEVLACENFGLSLSGTGTIDKCTVDGCLGSGIEVDTDDLFGSTVTSITKNTVTRCVRGIDLQDGPFLVEKNTCEQNLQDGLRLDIPVPFVTGVSQLATSLSKNECRNNGSIGFNLVKGSGPEMTVDKNVAEDNGLGMDINGFQVTATGNTIEHNREVGVFLFTTDSTFSNNKVRGNGLLGVLVLAQLLFADGGSVNGSNLVQGNTVQDNGGDGIRVQSDLNTVDDNVIKGNLGDGVQLIGSGVIQNNVTNNVVSGNRHDGIDNSALVTLISDNNTKDNGGADLAGVGNGGGNAAKGSEGNTVGDDSGLTSQQELEMETLE